MTTKLSLLHIHWHVVMLHEEDEVVSAREGAELATVCNWGAKMQRVKGKTVSEVASCGSC